MLCCFLQEIKILKIQRQATEYDIIQYCIGRIVRVTPWSVFIWKVIMRRIQEGRLVEILRNHWQVANLEGA
ncbi:unnamed protein product [Calypogeia fissa]